METHSVQLGSITLHGYAEVDPFVGLVVSRINGWRGLPGARGDNDPIPGGHGSYSATRVLREERSIELVGAAVAATELEATAMLDALEATVGDVPVLMTVHDADGAWSRVVEVQSVQISGAWNRDRIIFSIDAIAADPRRYRATAFAGPVGIPIRVGGLRLPKRFPWNFGERRAEVAAVENIGTVPLLPVVTVTGGAESVTVWGGSRRIMFGGFAGSLMIDNKARRAFLNGTDVTRDLLLREWHEVAAGETSGFWLDAVNPIPGTVLTVAYEIGAM